MNKDLHNKNSILANSKNSANKVAVYVRKNKQTDNTSANFISNKENVIDVNVANDSKVKTLLCVSCMQNVLLPCHDKCLANHRLNMHSNVSRTLSTNSRTPKSSDTTYVVLKTRFFEKLVQSKTLDTTFVVSKLKIDVGSSSKAKNKVVQIILWIVDSGCSKHMTGDRSLLRNFIKKFMGIIHFGNDNFAAITCYGNYIQGNITICHVYYVEGLGHNLFSVGQFYDGDLEVAFRSKTCYQFEKLVNTSRAKMLEKSHDLLALVAHTGLSSRNISSYYVTHHTSVVDFDDEYQQDDIQTNPEDPGASAMLLLSRAITQNFSNPTNNRLRTSSNTKNQVIIQGDRVNIQSMNSDNTRRNNRRACVQEEVVEGSNEIGNDEAGVILTDEQNDFLFADASRLEEIKDLSVDICLMAIIQPTNNTSDVEPSYDSAFISEVQSSSINENKEQMYTTHTKIIDSTICDDQIDSNIIFDTPNGNVNSVSVEKDTHIPDLYALEQLARNAYQKAEKQQIFAQKVQEQNMTLTDDLLTGGCESNLSISISDMAASSPVCLISKATSTKSWLWHRRLSHLNFGTINNLTILDLVDGIPKFKYGKDHLCSACERGKSKKASHPPKLVLSDNSKLELLHMDLCGPMRVASINEKRYILMIVDDYSRYTWVYFLHLKDETPEIIKKFIAQAKLNYKAKVCKIRTDNGTEFKNATLKAHYEKLGIMQQFLTARTPQQNGVVERRNRTLIEVAQTMLIFSRLPEFLWAEAVATACFTQNWSIIHTRYNKTPYELLHGRKPNVEYFHVFGSLCYPTNNHDDLGKMKPKADIRVFIDSPSTSSINVKEHEAPPIETTSDEQTSQISLTEADEFHQEDSANFDGNAQFVPYNPSSYEAIESSSMALEPSNVHNSHQVQPSTHF
nr:retrovirus-related Pol polyprotein from transposon TNT 1-94 [Tanacetum cinerariifolium]